MTTPETSTRSVIVEREFPHPPEKLWRAYIQLTDVEAAFRVQKDQLGLRPIWHRLSHRIQAHILVCFLAYALQKTLEGWCHKAGLGRSAPARAPALKPLEDISLQAFTLSRKPEAGMHRRKNVKSRGSLMVR